MNQTQQELFALESRTFIGSPQGLGKAKKIAPPLHTPIKRKVLTAEDVLTEIEVTLEKKIGSGLGGVVYKGLYQQKEIAEKFSAELPLEGSKGFAKKFMETQFLMYRQTLPSYRTNFYAAMANHYVSLLIYDAGEFEFGSPFIPKLQYTCYDETSSGYCFAYEFIKGRPIRASAEERLLKEKLKVWKNFIAYTLGLWGLARQCDPLNINSAGNVFVVDEKTKHMKLIDVTPGIIGGQIYFLPLEIEYFMKGLLTGNFLPFADAVDIKALKKYQQTLQQRFASSQDSEVLQRLKTFEYRCKMFLFYLQEWRDSEYALLRSPIRIFECLFSSRVMKKTTFTHITNLEYQGMLSIEKSDALRHKVNEASSRYSLFLVRYELFIKTMSVVFTSIPRICFKIIRWFFVGVLLKAMQWIYRSIIFMIKVYLSKAYRRRVSREKIKEWIAIAQHEDRTIDQRQASLLKKSLADKDILEILEVVPLWSVAKIIKPPFIGTMANMTLIYLFFTTWDKHLLIPLFADGMIRCGIAIIFTGFRYKLLLALSLLPTIGFIIPVPTQMMVTAPRLTDFIVRHVLGVKIGMMVPGVDRHSFRTYFYMRLMRIPLFLMKVLAWPFKKEE